ncbi:Scr1 family TA system antitoxin-like transcriptional regulator [Nocardiopsis sp. CT-R113]|uniref:Scr1 family TA system antitoxin-like transcriptional regulator n=1 Tax=Nocardiopsis codii TaxID=3065942 RepID=A0ABU7K5E3_9ACTN|nr:Scr1 family TA system antitoxin-like transcriptional regulator [Nocardiopsis sp. CT-R113]MEE2037468.1 Scr1 family TA system antitoxin-like transcriptional regulator [Nocardiopsis sp. CT-R113]
MIRLKIDGEDDEARSRFGKLLKKTRGLAGLTQQKLAAVSLVGQSTISDLELGKKGTRRDQVVRLDAALKANGVLLGAWDAAFSGLGVTSYFREVAEAEQAATTFRDYSLGLVPGIFQVEEYARAISEIAEPDATAEAIGQIVNARQQRQRILDRSHPPRITALLDEVVLVRRFRNPHVMPKQIDRLLELSYRPRVDIQIILSEAEGHAGLGGSFTVMEVPGNGSFVYVESQQTGVSLKQPEIVARYDRTFAELRSAALPVTASRSKMQEIRGNIR